MSKKRNSVQYIVVIVVAAMTASPMLTLPLGIINNILPSTQVRNAYAATFKQDELEDEGEEVTIEDWSYSETTGGEMVSAIEGGVIQATYFEGYEPEGASTYVDNSVYKDVLTYTVVQQYDEAGLPIELLSTDVFAPDNTTYYIAAKDSILKEFPEMDSITLKTLGFGSEVVRIGIGDTWSKIRTEDGTEGYVLTSSISYDMVWVDCDFIVWVDTSSLILRSEPSVDSEIVANLYDETRLHVTCYADKWFKVTTDSGLTGFVYRSYTSQTPPPTPTPTPTPTPIPQSNGGGGGGGGGSSSSSSGYNATTGNVSSLPVITGMNGQSVANVAESMIGKPYVWCGESASGVDCSGLVVYCYRQVGVDNLPHFANSLATCGVAVAREDVQPGDVVCYETSPGYSGHCGIYVGNGQIVHASTYSTGVIYASIDRKPILAIRRIIQ
ncbi:MAG: NlpC/P60 family protein [Clostridia bacterium]|nr:NlpC/P60 family protein [Clostridia bacterium]